jgi:hypothetical protein
MLRSMLVEVANPYYNRMRVEKGTLVVAVQRAHRGLDDGASPDNFQNIMSETVCLGNSDTHRIEVLGGTVPSSLAATAPIVSRLTADAARVRDDRSGEMRHELFGSVGVRLLLGGMVSGKKVGWTVVAFISVARDCIAHVEAFFRANRPREQEPRE